MHSHNSTLCLRDPGAGFLTFELRLSNEGSLPGKTLGKSALGREDSNAKALGWE